MENVLDLLSRHHTPKKAASTKGGEYHSPCPACQGTDRFHVWPAENNGEGSWWCRGCGKGGDAIQFLREFENMSFREACARLGKEIDAQTHSQSRTWPKLQQGGKKMWTPDPPQTPPPEEWRQKAKKLVWWGFETLMQMPPDQGIKAWLAKRGIHEPAIKTHYLGWNPGENGKDIFRPRESWGLPTELKEDGKQKKFWIPQGLIIPLVAGLEVLRIRIRRNEGEPRYYVLPGSNMACLVAGSQNPRAAVIVESELDAIMLASVVKFPGVPIAAIALGNSSRKPDAAAAALLRPLPVILNALDYDKAGVNQGQWWTENFPQTIRWPVPKGKDPGEAYEQGADVAEWIKSGLPKGWFL